MGSLRRYNDVASGERAAAQQPRIRGKAPPSEPERGEIRTNARVERRRHPTEPLTE